MKIAYVPKRAAGHLHAKDEVETKRALMLLYYCHYMDAYAGPKTVDKSRSQITALSGQL